MVVTAVDSVLLVVIVLIERALEEASSGDRWALWYGYGWRVERKRSRAEEVPRGPHTEELIEKLPRRTSSKMIQLLWMKRIASRVCPNREVLWMKRIASTKPKIENLLSVEVVRSRMMYCYYLHWLTVLHTNIQRSAVKITYEMRLCTNQLSESVV